MSHFDVMVRKLGGKVSRMRPMPTIKGWQNGCAPGDHVGGCHGVETQVTYTLTEDPAWGKVDRLIVKALDAMKKKRVGSPLSELQEVAFACALLDGGRGDHLVAWRLLNTRHLVEEWGRIRKVALGEQKPRGSDRLSYGGGEPRDQVAMLSDVLRVRGILKAKQK